MSATRAHAVGLVDEVVLADRLDECVAGWVADLLACAPLSVRAIKEAAYASSSVSLERAFATRCRWEERRVRSADTEEGPRAFVEKRPPRWRGE